MAKVMEKIRSEMEEVRSASGGMLPPKAVVDYARNPETAMHGHFTWDDSKAGHEHRLWQARQLIAMVVTIEPITKQTIPMYVSLRADRAQAGGGYRATVEVLEMEDSRKRLLGEVLADLRTIRNRYAMLKRVAEIVDHAVDQIGLELHEDSEVLAPAAP
jgi:hypothetical protein